MRLPLPRPELRAFTAYGQRPLGDAIRLNANEWPEPTPAGAYVTQARFLDRGVALRDMSPWPGCDGCLRVSIGTPQENDRFLAALTSVFARATA